MRRQKQLYGSPDSSKVYSTGNTCTNFTAASVLTLLRMSEQNISGIIDSMEELYREHRRNGMSVSIADIFPLKIVL